MMNTQTSAHSSTAPLAPSPSSPANDAEFELWLRQFQPAAPSAELAQRLALALELPPELEMSPQEQEQLENWLVQFQPAASSEELAQRLAQTFQERKPKLPQKISLFPLVGWQVLSTAAALALVAWGAVEFFGNQAASESPTLVETDPLAGSTQETSPSLAIENKASEAVATSPEAKKIAQLPLFPQPSVTAQQPFEFLLQDSPYQQASFDTTRKLSPSEVLFSGPPVSKGWEELELLQPQISPLLLEQHKREEEQKTQWQHYLKDSSAQTQEKPQK